MGFLQKENYGMQDLLSIMETLRLQCPWDKQQTHKSIRKNLIEETYEAVEAIDNEDSDLLKEELGDLLLQVVFHAQIEKEAGSFSFEDVCNALCKKLITRHPHVFEGAKATDAEQALQSWDEIKKREKAGQATASLLESVPRVLPALMRAQKVQQRAAKTGFDYPDVEMALSDLRSEVEELVQALDKKDEQAQQELGDLIFSAVNVSRFIQADPEEALSRSCDKFIARFTEVEKLACKQGVDMQTADIQVLDGLWKEAKQKLKVKNFLEV